MASALEHRHTTMAVLAVAVSATLLWFGTGFDPMWPLLWFAPLPVLLVSTQASLRKTAVVAFAAWLIGNLNLWTYYRSFPSLAAAPAIVIGFAVAFMFAVLLFRTLVRRGKAWTALLAFPAAWVSFEYVLNLSWPHGTFANLAYTQLKFLPFLQLAALTGPWGMSFLLLLFPAAIALGLHLIRCQPKTAVLIATTSFGLIGAVLVSGAMRLALPLPVGAQTARVGLVASGAPSDLHMAKPGAAAVRLFDDYAKQVAALAARGAKVVVLPEKIAVVSPSTERATDALFQSLSNRTETVIAIGVAYVASQQNQRNQARIYIPNKSVQTYAKHHLVPLFEDRFTPGTKLVILDHQRGIWGVEICKDMDFTQLSRRYGKLGVDLMLVPAWDFGVDRALHSHMAIMRGVESGFSMVRSAKHGLLAVSDNRGRILAEARSDSAPFVTMLANVPVVHRETLFLAWGDWFAWVALALLVYALLKLSGPSVTATTGQLRPQ